MDKHNDPLKSSVSVKMSAELLLLPVCSFMFNLQMLIGQLVADVNNPTHAWLGAGI